MATQPLFKDVGKRVNDLITKDFPSDKREQKVEWKSTTGHGVKLEFNIKTDQARGEPKTVGLAKNEFKFKPYDVTSVVEINTDKEAKVEFSNADRLLRGLKTTIGLQSQAKKTGLEYFETLSLEYRHEFLSATASAEFGRATDNSIKSSVVVGTQGVTVGTSAEYLRRDSGAELKELKSSVGYASTEFDIVAYGKVAGGVRRNTEVGASYFHKISPALSVGTQIKFDVTNKDTDKKPVLEFGTTYVPTPGSVVKARFDTEGKLALSQQLEINKAAVLTGGVTFNTADLSGKDAVQYGFGLSLSG